MDVVSPIIKRIRNECTTLLHSERVMAGIQLIVASDFLQSSPIETKKSPDDPAGLFYSHSFLFQSQMWQEANFIVVILTHIFRQDHSEIEFISALSDLRRGVRSEKVQQLFEDCKRPLTIGYGIEPTRLECTHAAADAYNTNKQRDLPGAPSSFLAIDSGDCKSCDFFEHNPAPKELSLKVGDQVMLVWNLSFHHKLINGSRGIVVAFDPASGYPNVRFTSGLARVIRPQTFFQVLPSGDRVQRVQVPLILAWAITVHKAQGSTLDWVVVNLDHAFDFGMAYVACSRVRSKSHLQILSVNWKNIRAHPAALSFYQSFP
jgi:ATP-dependent DNA helicase PIF1